MPLESSNILRKQDQVVKDTRDTEKPPASFWNPPLEVGVGYLHIYYLANKFVHEQFAHQRSLRLNDTTQN